MKTGYSGSLPDFSSAYSTAIIGEADPKIKFMFCSPGGKTAAAPGGYLTVKVTVTVAETEIFAARTTVAASISAASPKTLREKLLMPLS